MSNNSSNDSAILLAIATVGGFAFIVWQFSTFVGLDMSSGGAVFLRLVVLVAMVVASWKFGDDFDPIRLGNIWPVLLAGLWCCWWPALDFWASQQRPAFFSTDVATIWWAAWYTKWLGAAAIIGLGYLGRQTLQNDY